MTSIAHSAKALELKEETSTALTLAPGSDGELTQEDAQQVEVGAARQGIRIGGDVVTKATEKLPQRERTLVRWLHDRARTMGWSYEQLFDETGISQSVAFRVFRGEYFYQKLLWQTDRQGNKISVPHPKAGQPISLENVCKKIEQAKRNVEKTQTLFSVGFLRTSAWEHIEWACDQALKKNRINFVYGEGQIGKTTCLEEFARQHNGGQTKLVRIPPAGGVMALLRAIAHSAHIANTLPYHTMLEKVLGALDKSKLLIFDEIHEIFICHNKSSVIRCMELIRYIWDMTHCGMVLTGTKVFQEKMHEGEFFQMLQQLLRRGLREVPLDQLVKPMDDLNLALKSYGLEWPDDVRLQKELEHLTQDGFGQVLTALDDGWGLAEKAGHTYTWADFIRARNIVRKMTLKTTEVRRAA